jgi:endonuclease/exonuclease/phosphatase family metal-dependent hydrolase
MSETQNERDRAGTSARPGYPARLRPRGAVLLLAILAATAAFLFVGQIRHPTVHASGRGLNGVSRVDSTAGASGLTFRVATFNIHSGVGRDGRPDLSRTAAALDRADLIGLNEVRGGVPWNRENQAQALGALLNCGWIFAPTERRWGCDYFGNALLARREIGAWERVPLTGTQSKGHRNMVIAEATVAHRPVRVLITHVSRSVDRPTQLAEVLGAFLDLPPPAVLMGDFNTHGDEEPLKDFLRRPDAVDAVGRVRGESGRRGVDWIIVRGLNVVDAGWSDNGASDHPSAWAELQLPAAPTAKLP